MAAEGAAELVPDEYALRVERAAEKVLGALAEKGTIDPGATASCRWDEANEVWQLTISARMTFSEDPG